MNKELKELWDYLNQNCRGKANALKVGRLSWRLNYSERQIRAMAEELTTRHGCLVASTVHPPYGLFIPITAAEKEEYLNQLKARIKALASRWRAFSHIPLKEVIEQMELDYV